MWWGKCSKLRRLCFFLSFVSCSPRVYKRCIEINLTLQHSCSVSRSERPALSDKRKCRNRAAAPGLGAMLPPLFLSLFFLFLLEAPAHLFLAVLRGIFPVRIVLPYSHIFYVHCCLVSAKQVRSLSATVPSAGVRFRSEPGTGFIFLPADCRSRPGGEPKNNLLTAARNTGED